MLFSSIPFLYYFLPMVMLIYFGLPKRMRNAVLLVASLFFYFYGEPTYTLLLLFSSIIDYGVGLCIEKYRGKKGAKIALVCSLVSNLAILFFFKYIDFFIANANALFSIDLKPLGISLPLGISFFTFQTMSYSLDVYRNEAPVQRNPFHFATYVSLFPQLVAGPIVRYKTVAAELENRKHSFEDVASGITRFLIGMGKKVLIANLLGEFRDHAMGVSVPSVLSYWCVAVVYALQIYFDFSAYSDMAIGLGRIFGFHFLENFNYPFIAKSVSEFWRRWHISLGTWFREYLYIPLGGNRVSTYKWIRNIFIVWFCTGFWHGASWNYVFWGLYFGLILVLERIVLAKPLAKLPSFLQHGYTICLVLFSFVLFQMENLPELGRQIAGMFGGLSAPFSNAEALYHLRNYGVVFLVALLGATPLPAKLVRKVADSLRLRTPFAIATLVFDLVLLLAVTGYLVDSSFNPFLYFRF